MQLCLSQAQADASTIKLISVYYNTQEDIANPQRRRLIFNNILTHIQLTNKACKVVVLEILGKDFACKRSLIVDQESGSILQE
jgi:E3 ubiquitin-protein ligase DOA10